MTKGLMDRSLHHEMVLERVREKARLAEEELLQLKNWKVVTEQKLKLAERARDEYQKMTEELKIVLEDKENDLRLAKERAVQEYRDSDALLSELGVSYNDRFDDALRQAKALYLSSISQPSTSPLRRLRPFILMCLMIRMSFLQRRCLSPSPLRFRMKKKRLAKQKTPLLLRCKNVFFFLFFIFLKYFENIQFFARCISG